MKLKIMELISVLLVACMLAGCTADAPHSGGNGEPSTAPSAPVEAKWTLHVDHTIPVEKDGMTVNYTLVLAADKQGGTDICGTYLGNANIKVEMDASKLSNEVIKMLGGFKMEAYAEAMKFDVVPHDAETFQEYYTYEHMEGFLPPLKPVRDYNGMALISPDMKGTGLLNIQAHGIQGEKAEKNESAAGIEAIPMRILVSDLDVFVEAPALRLSGYFRGQLTGEPIK